MTVRILHGDCAEVMKTLPDCSVDAIVTDPPYGLTQGKKGGSGEASVNLNTPQGRARVTTGFMGMKWDADVPPVEVWIECLRVLKPGGYLLAFAGTRTQHRMCTRIEDAGFEIRDMIAWLYGSGFPKSHNGEWGGTALKPALEPITVARKPLAGTVESNWREHGTGALNIDACRVLVDGEQREPNTGRGALMRRSVDEAPRVRAEVAPPHELGRWPANVIHDGSDDVVAAFPEAPGQIADASSSSSRKTQNVYGAMRRGNGREGEASANSDNDGAVGFHMRPGARRLDCGSAARFFYCAKADKHDRNEGLEGLEGLEGRVTDDGRQVPADNAYQRGKSLRQNFHPTVKPTDLMRYLIRLVTPAGGVVLDPFMGSGSTLKAAELEGFSAIGIELDPQYIEIARRRIAADAPLFAHVE